MRPVSRPPSPRKPQTRAEASPSPSPSVYSFNKDPEEGLVDWTNVEADLSGEFEDRFGDARDREMVPGANEKVLVSVRVRPPGLEKDGQAWVMCVATHNATVMSASTDVG